MNGSPSSRSYRLSTPSTRPWVSSGTLPALARRACTAASSTTASSLGRSWVEERVSPGRFMERASSSRLDRRAVRYSPSSTRMRSKARARSPTSPPERTADGGRAKSPLAMALACSASPTSLSFGVLQSNSRKRTASGDESTIGEQRMRADRAWFIMDW